MPNDANPNPTLPNTAIGVEPTAGDPNSGSGLLKDLHRFGCALLNAGCFAAGTKLWTPDGYRNVEDIREGEMVFSRDQYRVDGSIEAKPVEKIFQRLTEVQHLHLRGPNGLLVTIRTTSEHPFYAYNRGWVPLEQLTNADWVLTDIGEWAKVEEVFATGELEVVYNLRVADWHTYFVGEQEWDWHLWAHNFYLAPVTMSAGTVNEKVVLEIRKKPNESQRSYVSADWTHSVQAANAAHTFANLAVAKTAAAPINKLSQALTKALEAYHSPTIIDELFTTYGQGYKGNFGDLEGNGIREDETEITTGVDGLFYALVYAPQHGSGGNHRQRLTWPQAETAFNTVNREADLRGDARWQSPQPQTNAAIERLKPTSRPGGYDIPAPVDPAAADVQNPTHAMAARYERVLAYQVHQGGGKFGAAQIVVWWGDTIGSNGSGDVISVDPITGQVTLWDSKAYANGKQAIESDTFADLQRQGTAVIHARIMVDAFAWKPDDLVSGGLRDKAIASIDNRDYKMFTIRYKAVGNNFIPLHKTETLTHIQ